MEDFIETILPDEDDDLEDPMFEDEEEEINNDNEQLFKICGEKNR